MKKSYAYSIPVVLISTILFAQASWALKAYVTDPKEVVIRIGPGSQHRVLTSLPSGTAVEVLRTNEWSRIQFSTPAGETKEGYALRWSLGAQPPEEILTRELQNENTLLSQKLTTMEREKDEISQREKALMEKLGKLEGDYEKLKSGSANYVALRDEHESTKVALATAQDNSQTLEQENRNLKISENVKWLAIGAGLILVGWIIGRFFSRSSKKHHSPYYL